MKKNILLASTICFVLTLAVGAQTKQADIEAVTPAGKVVVLKADGTWTFKPVVKGKVLGVTKAGFAAIEEGMSYAEVVEIIGAAGDITSESSSFGSTTILYSWKPAKGFGSLSAVFQGDKLASKSQFGLK